MDKNGCGTPACGTTDKKDGACGTKTENACGPKKGCCGTMIKGALLGGIIAFIYLSASWMVLPWHMTTMGKFENEKAVASVLLNNAPKSGVYVLPFMESPDQKPGVDKPFAFVSVLKDGFDCVANMQSQMLKQFLLCLAIAGLLTCLLKKQSGGCPIVFSMKVGVLVALVHNVPNYLWWHFPADFTVMGMADDFMTFTLAGFAISKFVLKKSGGCGCGNPNCNCGPGSCGPKTGGCA